MVIIDLLLALLLVCLGLLLGATWTTRALAPKRRQAAEERRRLSAEWSAVRTARRQRTECPRCSSLLSERDWHYSCAPTLAEDDLSRGADEVIAGAATGLGRA